jgi:hypothetical protein
MKMPLLSLVLLAVAATGCHGSIGSPCNQSSDCGGGQVCGTNYPGGYCYIDCTNAPSVCPGGSTCASTGTGVTAECYDNCVRNGDCRGGYSCVPVSDSVNSICLPL